VARRPEPTSLVAGIVVILFGTVLMLDTTDVIDLRLAALAPMACAVAGAVLLASGLGRRG
jgi:hypothetical protein